MIQYAALSRIKFNISEYWMPPPSRGMTTDGCARPRHQLFLEDFNHLALTDSTTRYGSLRSQGRRAQFGQIYPVPDGDLKQPTDSGITCFGSHSTTFGK